jgi:hypothetical protein
LRPLAVLIAIVFGSAAAIGFGLSATLVVFAILLGEHPELADEFAPLGQACALFLALTAVAGMALRATLKQLPWRGYALGALVAAVVSVGVVYWPTGSA